MTLADTGPVVGMMCFAYCGDDQCICDMNPKYAEQLKNVPHGTHLTFPNLIKLAEATMCSWQQNGIPVAVQAGQRSGKTTLAKYLMERMKYIKDVTHIIGATKANLQKAYGYELAKQKLWNINDLKHIALRHFVKDHVQGNTLVIIEEPFWFPNSEEIFNEVSLKTPFVLAIGSKGPHQWKDHHRIWKYATWELNPNITRQDLDYLFTKDFERAQRDYGS